MRKLTLPLLISIMVLSLIGIIIIQYSWINKSVTEKRILIDHKVHGAIDNVDQQLSDYNTMMFMSLGERVYEKINKDSSFVKDSLSKPFDFFAKHHGKFGSFPGGGKVTISMSSDEDSLVGESFVEEEHIQYNDSSNIRVERRFDLKSKIDMDTLDSGDHVQFTIDGDEAMYTMYSKVENLLKRVEVELDDALGANRMDSSKIAGLLDKEFKAMGLNPPKAWAVYDNVQEKELISPSEKMDWDFVLPLNKNDVIHPNRFEIKLNIAKSELLWSDLRTMILLSLLFLAIMFVVFIYAIRLVIKHKNISQIKSDFINNMTHEFKTPLASISLAADSVVHPNVKGNWSEVEKYMGIIQKEKAKLNEQVEQILEVAALEKDALNIPTKEISINEIIRTSAQKLGFLLEENHAQLTISGDEDAKIIGNEFYLERVFSNIIENSIKYSKDKPVIFIKTQKKNQSVEVTIEDRGIGMTKQQIEKAFDNFYRVQSGNVHDTKGFGLGLSYAKLITEKLKGTIKIEGQANEGCTVRLEFPLAT